MLDPRERTAVFLLAGTVAVIVLIHLSVQAVGPESFAAPYTESSAEGEYVTLTGTVQELRTTTTGGHLLFSLEGALIFVPESVASSVTAAAGDVISVAGTVQTYRGTREIVVSSPSGIRIIRHGDDSGFP
jgi:DNA/RNA endonuclease YhcR with UshA esterase domain